MAREKHTTVNLTENSQLIKTELAPVFGLKNILSAGLILFGRLSSDDQKKIIAEANKKPSLDKSQKEPTITECIQIVSQYVRYHIPSEDEAMLIQSLRKQLGPDPKQKRKRG